MGLSRIFDISTRSLATYQQALDVTAHNISNSSNADYSRQRAILSTSKPNIYGGYIWGSGIQLSDISRVRDSLTDAQIRSNNYKYGDNSKKSELLGQVESLFSEPSGSGLSDLINGFFDSWNKLTVTPNSTALRYNVIQSAQQLSSKVQNINENIDTIKSNIFGEVKADVSTINTSLQTIQSLNEQIFQFQSRGQSPNDLMDQRDKAVDDLSKIVNLNISYDNSGSVNLSIGGVFALDKSNYTQFKVASIDGALRLQTADGNTNVSLKGGELNGLMEMHSKTIPEYQQNIDDIFNTLVSKVNEIHSTGTTIGNPPVTGVNFFDGYKNGELVINDKILNDPNSIAVSADGTAGNGDIALALSDLSNAKILNGSSLSDNYSALISKVGTDKKTADQLASSANLILQQLDQQKSSYSGVSIDEEMSNVLKFQKSYEASAKLVKIADQMLDTIINLV